MKIERAEKGFHRCEELVGTPYVWDGGHKNFGPDHGEDPSGPIGEDCSGFASDIMNVMGILGSPHPLDVEALSHWGLLGQGQYFTLLVIVRKEIEHCLLRFSLPSHPQKRLIAARHTGTKIEWYPMTVHIESFLSQGYTARRWAD